MSDPGNYKDDKEFLEFMNSKDINLPEELGQKVLNFVKNDLNPSHKIVFGKFLAIQAFIGFLTLLFCPQFSLSLTNNFELFHYFHHTFGERVCMAICGLIFIGSGAIFATYVLKQGEVRKIKESRFLYYFSITSIALSSFIFLGADTYLNLAVFWFLGASFGGLIMFEINRFIRKEVFQY